MAYLTAIRKVNAGSRTLTLPAQWLAWLEEHGEYSQDRVDLEIKADGELVIRPVRIREEAPL